MGESHLICTDSCDFSALPGRRGVLDSPFKKQGVVWRKYIYFNDTICVFLALEIIHRA